MGIGLSSPSNGQQSQTDYAPPQPVQAQSPMQQSPSNSNGGKSGGLSNLLQTPQDTAQTQGQQPQMGQPNQYAQTIGMGDNTGSKTPSPIGAGGKSGKGG